MARSPVAPVSLDDPHTVPTRWWHEVDDGRIQCDVCPRACKLHDGQRGLCFVRGRTDDQVVLTTFGRSSGYCIDPIEKKPLNHVLPGTPILSFGTAGCNLSCRFCQNWDISKSREIDTLGQEATPDAIAAAAVELGCPAVAFTYNDPIVFLEYAVATAEACRARGVRTVGVTNGSICPGPAAELFGVLDAANIDLKAFTDEFYVRLTGAHLGPVLDTIAAVVHDTACWVELTTLLIPGYNDADEEIGRLARWVVTTLGPDVPLHFTAFHPDFKLVDAPRTPPSTLRRAREVALDAGVHHVYTGNVHDPDGGVTRCTGCGRSVIERDRYVLGRYDLDDAGRCRSCGTVMAGVFDGGPGGWGARRVPVSLGRVRR